MKPLATRMQPQRTDAIFDVRFISKVFTDFEIPTLIDQGRFGLDQPLVEILPKFKKVTVRGEDHPPSSPITIGEMMLHSSGISDDIQP